MTSEKVCTVIPRASSSSLTNHSFSLWKWCWSLYTPSKNSSRFRNACRASDWWHHLISSSRFQYPNNSQKKNSKAHTRHDDIRMSSEKVINCYHESQQHDVRTRFLSFGFRYENGMRPLMFEQRRVWRIAIFRWIYSSSDARLVTPWASPTFHLFLFLYINHFHYGINVMQF